VAMSADSIGKHPLVFAIDIKHGNAAALAPHEADSPSVGKPACNLGATDQTEPAVMLHHRLFVGANWKCRDPVGSVIGLPISKIICFHLSALQKMLFLPAGALPASRAIASNLSVERDIEMPRRCSRPDQAHDRARLAA